MAFRLRRPIYDFDTWINLKKKLCNTCILVLLAIETTTLNIKSANKLKTIQTAVEWMMLV